MSDNVMATLICLENAKSMEDMTSTAKGLIPLMKSAHNKELNDVFLKWLKTEYMVERNLSSLSEIMPTRMKCTEFKVELNAMSVLDPFRLALSVPPMLT